MPIELAREMGGAFYELSAIFTVLLVLLWIWVAGKTAVRAWQRTIFVAPCVEECGGEVPRYETGKWSW